MDTAIRVMPTRRATGMTATPMSQRRRMATATPRHTAMATGTMAIIGLASTTPTTSRLTRNDKRKVNLAEGGAALRAASFSRGRLYFGQSVERSLQDEGGSVLIDHGSTLPAADVGGNQFPLHRDGRKPLIPQSNRQFGELGEIAGEGAGRLRARALAAIHIDWQAKHESDGGAFTRKLEHALRVGGEALSCDGLHARCELSIGIAGGNADRLGAEIEADERPTGGQVCGSFSERQNDGH